MNPDDSTLPAQSRSAEGRPELVVLTQEPLNAETPLSEQSGMTTANHLFYVRSHNSAPPLTAEEWRLELGGLVRRPRVLSFDELLALPSRSLLVTMECAGNGRAAMQPKVSGEQWGYGAVSTASWTGVPLSTVLETAGLTGQVQEVLCEGADRGAVEEGGAPIPFIRSLPLQKALHPDTILAYRMNGEPLQADHGFPVRLIVPGWYGMASVKWITRLEAIAESFAGYYQADRYVMAHPERGEISTTPLTTMRVRSIITNPGPNAELAGEAHLIEGLAWSGAAPIAGVAVSVDGGTTWQAAETVGDSLPYAWQRWQYWWRGAPIGSAKLCSRAIDQAGRAQPCDAEWNCLGYANNAVQVVQVTVL